MKYKDEKSIIESIGEPLDKASKEDIQELMDDFEGVPGDFIVFLQEVGFGNIGNGMMQIYNGLISPDEIYDPDTAEELGDVLLFGDDYQGYGLGFAIKDAWKVVEIDPTLGEVDILSPDFKSFISGKVLRFRDLLNSLESDSDLKPEKD